MQCRRLHTAPATAVLTSCDCLPSGDDSSYKPVRRPDLNILVSWSEEGVLEGGPQDRGYCGGWVWHRRTASPTGGRLAVGQPADADDRSPEPTTELAGGHKDVAASSSDGDPVAVILGAAAPHEPHQGEPSGIWLRPSLDHPVVVSMLTNSSRTAEEARRLEAPSVEWNDEVELNVGRRAGPSGEPPPPRDEVMGGTSMESRRPGQQVNAEGRTRSRAASGRDGDPVNGVECQR